MENHQPTSKRWDFVADYKRLSMFWGGLPPLAAYYSIFSRNFLPSTGPVLAWKKPVPIDGFNVFYRRTLIFKYVLNDFHFYVSIHSILGLSEDLGFGCFFFLAFGPFTGGITYKDVANYLFKNKVLSMAAARQPGWSSVIYWGSSMSRESFWHNESVENVLTVAFEHYWKT